MARRADNVHVLAHAATLGRRPFHSWAQLPGSWTLVTDEDVHPEAVAPFVAAGVDVVIVDSGGRAEKA